MKSLIAIVFVLFAGFANAQNVVVVEHRMEGGVTAAEVLATEKVLAETRTMRQIFAGAGAAFGTYAGYSAATAAGLSPAGVAATAVTGAVIYGATMYGASTAGLEYAISNEADRIKTQLANLKRQAEEAAKESSMLEQGKKLLEKFKKEVM